MENVEKRRCPACKSRDTRRSFRRGWLDNFLSGAFQLKPFRCHSCRHRFRSRHVEHSVASEVLSGRRSLPKA